MRLLLSLSSVAVVIGLAAPAHADANQDQAFLAAVKSAGIVVKNPDDAIVTGKAVCESVQAGKQPVDPRQEPARSKPGTPAGRRRQVHLDRDRCLLSRSTARRQAAQGWRQLAALRSKFTPYEMHGVRAFATIMAP